MDKPRRVYPVWEYIAKRVTRRTQRLYVCHGCGEFIPAGSRVVRVVGKLDGRFHMRIYCGPCAQIAELYGGVKCDIAAGGMARLSSQLRAENETGHLSRR